MHSEKKWKQSEVSFQTCFSSEYVEESSGECALRQLSGLERRKEAVPAGAEQSLRGAAALHTAGMRSCGRRAGEGSVEPATRRSQLCFFKVVKRFKAL